MKKKKSPVKIGRRRHGRYAAHDREEIECSEDEHCDELLIEEGEFEVEDEEMPSYEPSVASESTDTNSDCEESEQ